jgi:hypothetical protein
MKVCLATKSDTFSRRQRENGCSAVSEERINVRPAALEAESLRIFRWRNTSP